MDECTGHVLVHYLYTGLYQTLNDIETSLVPEANTQFKRAVSAYTAANKYGLFGLQQLAKHKIEFFGAEVNIFDVVEAIKEDSSKLLCDDPCFYDYLGGKVKTAFEGDHTVFARDNFFDRINDVALAKVMAKCLVELYNNKFLRMLNTQGEPVPGISEECTPDAQNSPEEAEPEECCAIEETLAEECSAPELSIEVYPTQEYPIRDIPVEEPPIQEGFIKEHVTTEDSVESNFGTFDAVPEPIPVPDEVKEENDPWSLSFDDAIGKKKKKKKGKKCAVEEIKEEPEVNELPTPAFHFASPVNDDGGAFVLAGKYIEEPSQPPPEPGPAPAEEMNDDGWGNWAIPKKSKKKKKGSVFTAVPDPPKEELNVENSAPEPVAEEKQDEDWSNCALKGVVEDATPPPISAVPEPKPEPIMEKNEAGNWGFSSIWIGGGNKNKGKSAGLEPAPVVDDMTVVQKADGTVVNNGHSGLKAEFEQYIEAGDEICPVRAKHLLGDEWKHCRQCRVMLRQVAIQLARAGHADEDEYVVVDQMSMK